MKGRQSSAPSTSLLPSSLGRYPFIHLDREEQVSVKSLAPGHNTRLTRGSNLRLWDMWWVRSSTAELRVKYHFKGSETHPQFSFWLLLKYPHLWRSTLQRFMPVLSLLSLLRYFYSVHKRSAPAGSSLQGFSNIGVPGERSESFFLPHSDSHALWDACWEEVQQSSGNFLWMLIG